MSLWLETYLKCTLNWVDLTSQVMCVFAHVFLYWHRFLKLFLLLEALAPVGHHRGTPPPTPSPSSPFLSPSQVENPSQFIQGYRVLFRQTSGLPSPGPWQIQDLKVASERDITLSALKKGIVYEIKVRPYFNEFQGADSESMTARTMEEGTRQINSHFWQNNRFLRWLYAARNTRVSDLCMSRSSCVNCSAYFFYI